MAAKKPPTKRSSASVDEAKREQPLQAVLLTDSFTNSFMPLSLDRPKVLCPLNNVTLIDYSIDFLAGAGVEEIFVLCVSDKVEAYIHERAKTLHNNSLQITVIKDSSLANAGDALRELDRRDLVQSDPFILMFADVVANVNLTAVLAAHKERHKKDRSAIMTLLMKNVGDALSGPTVCSPLRTAADDLMVGLDPTQENRILVYSDHDFEKSVPVPCSFMTSHPEIDLRCDLLDCGIDICSLDVLARFTDEFDYDDIRRHFVANSVAEEEEGLQNKIFAHLLGPNDYAARVRDFLTYATISRDVLQRWCYPVVPNGSSNLCKSEYRYEMQRQFMYYERRIGKIRVARSSTIRGAGMMGSNCFIGEECRIRGTVIGNHCHVGAKVMITGSHIWDGVEIEDGATIVESILADGCVIRSGAEIPRGCIIGAGCIVGVNAQLAEFTRLTLAEEGDDDAFGDDWDEDRNGSNDRSGALESESNIVASTSGIDGKGRSWLPSIDDSADSEDEFSESRVLEISKAQSIGIDLACFVSERRRLHDEDDDELSKGTAVEFLNGGSDVDGAITFATEGSIFSPSVVGRQKGVDVIKELKAICLEYESTSPIENLAIELNSFKFSQNATYADCTMAAMLSILERMKITLGTKDGKLVTDFKAYLQHWAPLLQKMSIGLEEEKAIVAALERKAMQEDEAGQVLSSGVSFRFLLQTLHDEEIVSEEAILSWAADRRKEPIEEPRTKLFQMQSVQDFLAWLEEDSEEGGSGSDDGNSEGS